MPKIKKKIAEKVFQKKSVNTKKSINPFEVHINKQKYEVLGQKLKNDRGLPGVSRAKAIRKRKHTLLPEYSVKHKSNKFVDKRIGEKNHFMSEEDRTMARFTAERMKHHNRKSMYNLADDEILTHRGQTLNEIEKFDDPRSDDDDDIDDEGRKPSGKLDDNFVGDAHFGGGVLTKTGKEGAKSHKDLIDQLIAESKKRKAEKQKTKEETLELTEKLDSEWKDLLPLVSKSKNSGIEQPEVHQKPDDYDKVMRELKFEARGNPTDRLKSEDEIAKEEKDRLEKLEQDRINRMMGNIEKPTVQHRSADDLDDNFNYDSDIEETLAYDDEGKLKNAINFEIEMTENNEKSEKEQFENESENDESSDAETDDDLSDLKQSESSDEEVEELKTVPENNKIKKTKTKKDNEKQNKNKNMEKGTVLKFHENCDAETDDDLSDLKESESSDEEVEESKTVPKNKIKKTETKKENEKQNKNKNMEKGTVLKSDENSEAETDEDLSDLKESESSDEEIEKLKTVPKNKINKTENKNVTKETKTVNEKQKNKNMEKDTVLKSEITIKEEEFSENETRKEIIEQAKKELPYTYSLPDSYESLQSLLSVKSPEYQNIIIERMIKCNHPSLAEENKDNLSRLFVYILQHLNDVAPEKTDNIENIKHCFAVLNNLTPHLYTLAQYNPQNARDSLIEVIKEKQSDYKKHVKQFPSVDVLIFLKLVSCLFSTSDFRHQVVTPCLIFISQMLTNCKVKTRYDMVYGLFLVTLFVEYTILSKRYLPAALIFLMGIIHMAVPKIGVRLLKIYPPFKNNSTNLVLLEPYKTNVNSKMCAEDFVKTDFNEEFKVKILFNALNLCEDLQNNWDDLSSNIDIFASFFELLNKLPKENYPKNIQDKMIELTNKYEEMKSNKKLNYIVMEKKKPKALRLYEPNIQPVFEYKKAKPMSREKAEREKLLYKYKKEMKGAVREIRRDKSFLGRVKIKQQMQSDYERREKVKRIYAEASMQQSELNTLDRKKKRK